MPYIHRTTSERPGFWVTSCEPLHPADCAQSACQAPQSAAKPHTGHVSVLRAPIARMCSAPAAQSAWRAPGAWLSRTNPVHIEPGVKIREALDDVCQAAHVDPNLRISGLQTVSGHRYLCTRSIQEYRGSSGKVRYAMNTRGTFLFVKEVRTEQAFARGLAQRKKMSTAMTPRAMLRRELRLLQAIEPNLQVHDCIDVNGKIYVVMDAMRGDFWALVSSGPQCPKRHLVRTMMAEMARSLQRCHKAGYIHHDVKIENMLWAEGLELVLADYGYATQHHKIYDRPMPIAHRMPTGCEQMFQAGPPGTHPAPEMCMLNPATGTFVYDRSIDVWALGMAFVLSYRPVETSPFKHWRFWLDCGDYDQLRCQIASFTQWHQHIVGDDGRVRAKKLFKHAPSALQPCKWDLYFRPLFDADLKLFSFVLRYMLNPAPKSRASLAQIESFCQQLADDTPTAVIEEGRRLLDRRLGQAKAETKGAQEALRRVFYQATRQALEPQKA